MKMTGTTEDKTNADVGKSDLLSDLLCGCGRQVRYSHFDDNGNEVMSCNKHFVCMTYSEQYERLLALERVAARYKCALESIVSVNAMDYEYKAWAKAALAT
jgi:hypothetical protein